MNKYPSITEKDITKILEEEQYRFGRIQLLKLLLKGEWLNEPYLELATGKYLPPNLASRIPVKGKFVKNVEKGRAIIVDVILSSLERDGRVEKKVDDSTNMWRLTDKEWAKREVRRLSKEERLWRSTPIGDESPLIKKEPPVENDIPKLPIVEQGQAHDTSLNGNLLTVDEVARAFSISKPTLWRMIQRGEIPVVRIAQRNVRIKMSDVNEYIEKHYSNKRV